MVRPRWHDLLIVVSLLALFGVGVGALWGDTIAGWIGTEAPPEAPAPAPSRGPADGQVL